MNITIRPARTNDRTALIAVEAGATPNLSYVDNVFDLFLDDKGGEFTVAEIDGKVVACGKMTILPDGSAWLETIRVLPDCQGHGIGKRFYQRFIDIAHAQQIRTLRMYTGIQNAVSKGLAEHFEFELAETFGSASLALPISGEWDKPNKELDKTAPTFQPVTDPAWAAKLLLGLSIEWGGFMVMNRTFYRWTPELCTALVTNGQLYADIGNENMGSADTSSVNIVVVGARFMLENALHVGYFSGDAAACLTFAARLGSKTQCARLSCLFPIASTNIAQCLYDCGFSPDPAKLIVMERHLPV